MSTGYYGEREIEATERLRANVECTKHSDNRSKLRGKVLLDLGVGEAGGNAKYANMSG